MQLILGLREERGERRERRERREEERRERERGKERGERREERGERREESERRPRTWCISLFLVCAPRAAPFLRRRSLGTLRVFANSAIVANGQILGVLLFLLVLRLYFLHVIFSIVSISLD